MNKITKVLLNNKTINEILDDFIYKIIKENKDITDKDYNNSFPFTYEQFTQRIKDLKRYITKLDDLKRKPIIKQRTPEWFKARLEMLTASDTFDGCRKVKNLIRKKALQIDERINNYAIFWGTMLEPVALNIYSTWKQNIPINEFGLIPHDTMKHYGASPDGISDLGIMVEIKCPYSRKLIEDEIPPKYMAQMQGQMAVCNLEECDYCELKFIAIDVNEYLNNEDELCGMVIEKQDGSFIYSELDGDAKEEYIRLLNIDDIKGKVFWKLERLQVIRVDFNQAEWEQYYKPKIDAFWDEVDGFDEEIYQKTRKTRKNIKPTPKFIDDSD